MTTMQTSESKSTSYQTTNIYFRRTTTIFPNQNGNNIDWPEGTVPRKKKRKNFA